ncbi:MAG: trypsin-like peptidase domain-containing protein [Vicinamibacterales bacterium]
MTKSTSVFTAVLIAIMSLAAGLVLASRLDFTPGSEAQPMEVPAANSDPITGGLDVTTFRRMAEAVSPAVVSIQTEVASRQRETTDSFENNPFFGIPRGPQRGAPQPRPGSGTGFIIDKANGYILTNNHVVEGADKIKVGFFGDSRHADTFDAKVIGRDPLTDSALIQLTSRPSRELTQINFGDSDQIAAGDWVMAIGNPYNFRHTVTVGVVSAVGRDDFEQVEGRSQVMIQTDAAINPGNSGGPLLNVRGEVVGINTAIFTGEAAGNIGIGFAVPINAVRNLLPQLRTGRIIRGQLGVGVQPAPLTAEDARELGVPATGGALIVTVTEDSAAEKAGLRPGDIVFEFNRQPVRSSNELTSLVVQTKPGTTVPVKIVRNRQQRTINVTVAELDLLASSEEEQESRDGTDSGLGIRLEALTPPIARRLEVPAGQGGAVVSNVAPRSAAERSGLFPGDVILSVNGRAMRNVDEVSTALEAVTSSAIVGVWRQGREVAVMIRKR